jgi:hypothetical protein
MREKVAEGRMRGQQYHINQLCPLTLTLSLMERGFLPLILVDGLFSDYILTSNVLKVTQP